MKRLLILIGLLVAVCPRPAYATAQFVQGTIGTVAASGGGATNSCTVSATVNGNLIVVLFASDGAETVSSITDTNADSFTVVNALYTQSTNQKGGYATAVATASNTTITLTWSGTTTNRYVSCAEIHGQASCSAGACVDVAQGLGCTNGLSCGPTGNAIATQNDEIVLSGLVTNSAVTANTQISSDARSCTTSSSVNCVGNLWGAGAISTTHVAAYYRNVFSGGNVTCSWPSWAGSSISGVSCVSIKSSSNGSATFLQGQIAGQTTGSNTCTLPGSTTAGTVLIVLFHVSNATDTVQTPSGITDSMGNTFTIVNTIFSGGSSSSGGYATAVSMVGGIDTITIAWNGSGNHNAGCAEIIDAAPCLSNACVDSQIKVGLGCTSAGLSCGPTASKTADQNDEIIFSFSMQNGVNTVNTQTTSDTAACESSAPTTGSCAVTKWGVSGSASTTHGAMYYRNIAAGGAQTCTQSWASSVISSITCVAIKSGNGLQPMGCNMGLLGIGCHEHEDNHVLAIEEEW